MTERGPQAIQLAFDIYLMRGADLHMPTREEIEAGREEFERSLGQALYEADKRFGYPSPEAMDLRIDW